MSQDRNPGEAQSPNSWRDWLHGLGYVATAVIVFQVIAAAGLFSFVWHERSSIAAEQRSENRTREGHLPAHALLGGEMSMLPLVELGGDAFRFVTDEAGQYRHALLLSLPPGAIEATGTIILGDIDNPRARKTSRFAMPPSAYRQLVRQVDKLMEEWPGEAWGDTCQTANSSDVAFERLRGQRITSGAGFCLLHYDRLSAIVFEGIQPYVPCEALSDGDRWTEVGRWKVNCQAGNAAMPSRPRK